MLKRSRLRIGVLVLLLIAAVQLLPAPRGVRLASRPPEGARSVLFVGNSMTSNHDIPGLVEILTAGPACAAGPVRAIRELPGGVWLQQHWARGRVRELIERHRPVVVILQEQSEVTRRFPDLRERYTREFVTFIRAEGIEPLLYNIDIGWWSDSDRTRIAAEGARLTTSLKLRSVEAIRLFQDARAVKPDLEIFGPDNHHLGRGGAAAIAVALAGMLCGGAVPWPEIIPAEPSLVWHLLRPRGFPFTPGEREALSSCAQMRSWPWCGVAPDAPTPGDPLR